MITAADYYDWCEFTELCPLGANHVARFREYRQKLSAAGLVTWIVFDFLKSADGVVNTETWRSKDIEESRTDAGERVEQTALAFEAIGAARAAASIRAARDKSISAMMADGSFDPRSMFSGIAELESNPETRAQGFGRLLQGLAQFAQLTGDFNKPVPTPGIETWAELNDLLSEYVQKHEAALRADIEKHGDARVEPGFDRKEWEKERERRAKLSRLKEPRATKLDFGRFWEPETCRPSGVTDADVTIWEQQQGVRLPKALRRSLELQNGGNLRGNEFRIFPIEKMLPADEEWVESAYLDEGGEWELVFLFGQDDNLGGQYFLDYNVRGPDGEPTVLDVFPGNPELRRCADSVAEFFEPLLEVSESCGVDWDEIETLEVIADDTVEHGILGPTHNVLCRSKEGLVLFSHGTMDGEESFTRAEIPLPLDRPRWWSEMQAKIWQQNRTGGQPVWSVHLQSVNKAGIVHRRSTRTDDGWKTKDSTGVPIYFLFQTHDEVKWKALCARLDGMS